MARGSADARDVLRPRHPAAPGWRAVAVVLAEHRLAAPVAMQTKETGLALP